MRKLLRAAPQLPSPDPVPCCQLSRIIPASSTPSSPDATRERWLPTRPISRTSAAFWRPGPYIPRLPRPSVRRSRGCLRARRVGTSTLEVPTQPSGNRKVRALVVHPLSCCGIWHDGDPGAARGAVPPSTAPDEGMLVLVPVRGGPLDGFFDLGPGLEATPFEGQRAQDLPPRLDQVQVGRVFGLKHELPARVGQSKEQHIGCAVDVEVVHHGVDPRDIGVDPALDRAEEIDPVCGGAAGVRGGKGLPRSRSEGTEDIALAASAVVDLLLGPLCFGTGRLDHAPAGVAPGRLRPHLVEADDYAALGWSGVEALEHPLLRANSGSTRAPNQVSSWRHFSPSARRTSLTRLRFMPMPFLPK